MCTRHKTIDWKRSCIKKEKKDEQPKVERSHPVVMNAVIFRGGGSRGCGRGCLEGVSILVVVVGGW